MGKKKIMIVDDEKDFLEMLKLNLEQTGEYDILALLSAKDIVAKVHEFNPDVILLDILMPGIGGIEACELLNNNSIGKDIPIIAISALDKEEDKLKVYKVGVVDYITKPVETDEVVAKIEKALKLK